MRTRATSCILLSIALGWAVSTAAGKPAIPSPRIPVTVTFTDGTGNAVQSDGAPYINGTDGVTAVIVDSGNLQLKTGAARAFWLDFQRCVDLACSPPTFLAGLRQGYVTTWCPTALPGMSVGASQECNLNVHFTADQLGWFVRFGEDSQTSPATVSRVDPGNWTIEVPAEGVALLQSYPLKGRVTYTDHGSFHMPVAVTVTLQ